MKKNIVIVVHTDYPWKEGMSYRVHNMAECLSKEYQVTIVSPILESSYPTFSNTGTYHILRFDLRILQKIRKNRILLRLFFLLLFTLSMIKVRKKLPFKQNINIVQAEQQLSLMPARILSLFSRSKFILDDILSQKKYYTEYFGLFEVIIHSIETILAKQCSLIIATTKTIAQEIRATFRLNNSKIKIIPNGVTLANELEILNPRIMTKKDIVFVGSMYSEQNRRAVRNLLKIFPSVLAEVSDARLVIIGGPLSIIRSTLVHFEANLKRNVLILGYLSEAKKQKYLLESSVCALPFDEGDSLIGGIRLKALDFLSFGKIIVTTPTGVEGIDGASGENMVIVDRLEFFAKSLIDVLKYPEKYETLRKNGLKLVSNYAWKNVLIDYLQYLEVFT